MSNNGIPPMNDWQADNYPVIYDEGESKLKYVKSGVKSDVPTGGGSSYLSYTGLLNEVFVSTISGLLVIGKTYIIDSLENGDDFSNVGFVSAPDPFVATGTTPSNWSNGTVVVNATDSAPVPIPLGTPTITDLEFFYDGPGNFYCTSPDFVENKTWCEFQPSGSFNGNVARAEAAPVFNGAPDYPSAMIFFTTHNPQGAPVNNWVDPVSFEIRVYTT